MRRDNNQDHNKKFTNFDWFKSYENPKDLSLKLCELVECEECPVNNLCEPGRNGFLEWLEREYMK